jgi:hypothetical protein
MPINKLYHNWMRQICELRPKQRITQQRNFVWLMIGIYQSQSVYLSKIAGEIPGSAKLVSTTRRLSRFLNNPAVNVREWYQPIAQKWLQAQWQCLREIRLIVDGTKVGFGHQLLMVSMAYRKRAIPIAWTWVKHVRGHSSALKQLALMNYVRKLLPAGTAVFLVGDCEFGSVEVLKWLDFWHWFYVLRQKSGTGVWLNQYNEWKPFGSFVHQAGESHWLGDGYLTASAIYPTNLLIHWQTGEEEPWCLATNLPDQKMALKYYRLRMWCEIVFTQMTKTNVFTGWTGRDHVADLNIFVLDDHAINKQFYQFSFLFKVSVLQTSSNSLTEILYGDSQARELIPTIHLMRQLLFQILHALEPVLQIHSSALIFEEGDNLVQVGLCESIQLGLQGILSMTQIITTCLQFLRQPATALCSLPGSGNNFRVGYELTQILPDQFIQLLGWDVAGITMFVKMRINNICSPMAIIIMVAGMQGTAVAAKLAKATTYHSPQQILMGFVIATGSLLIVDQLGLDLLELLCLNNGWDGRDKNPLFFRSFDVTLSRFSDGMCGRTTQMRLDRMRATYVHLTGISRIGQEAAQGGRAPVFLSAGRQDPHAMQVLDQFIQSSVFIQIKIEHLSHHYCFCFVEFHLGGVPGTVRIHLVPIQWSSPRQQDSGPVLGLTAAPHPLGNQGTFVFCHGSPNLQKQLIVWILADRTIQKFNPTAIFLPFFQQQHLMNIIPCQTIRRSDHNTVYFPRTHPVPQLIQTRPIQIRATDPIISIDVLLQQLPFLLPNIGSQPFQLLLNGLCLRLMLSRNSRIDRYSHMAPPISSASGFPRRIEQSPVLTDTLDPIGSVHPDTPSLPVESSTGVSWQPPHSELSGVEGTPFLVAGVRNRIGRRQ